MAQICLRHALCLFIFLILVSKYSIKVLFPTLEYVFQALGYVFQALECVSQSLGQNFILG